MANITLSDIRKARAKLLPCPFCGSKVEIALCDDEGNFKPLHYLEDPYSGTSFAIVHPLSPDCLLHCKPSVWSSVGQFQYDELSELIQSWNHRWNGGAK